MSGQLRPRRVDPFSLRVYLWGGSELADWDAEHPRGGGEFSDTDGDDTMIVTAAVVMVAKLVMMVTWEVMLL